MRSVQIPLQFVVPEGHWQEPLTHEAPTGQRDLPLQSPALSQTSFLVQALPSSQAEPAGFRVYSHWPVDVEQVPVAWWH